MTAPTGQPRMFLLSCYTADGTTDVLIKEYKRAAGFWADWNGRMGAGRWCRTGSAPDGTTYTVKWQSRTFRNGAGKSVALTTALWVDGSHDADTTPRAEQPADGSPQIPATQAGRLAVGELLRSPHGTWTVTGSWIADRRGAPPEDRDYRSSWILHGSGRHVYYLLTHADGHQEEWSAPGMGDAGFHRIPTVERSR